MFSEADVIRIKTKERPRVFRLRVSLIYCVRAAYAPVVTVIFATA